MEQETNIKNKEESDSGEESLKDSFVQVQKSDAEENIVGDIAIDKDHSIGNDEIANEVIDQIRNNVQDKVGNYLSVGVSDIDEQNNTAGQQKDNFTMKIQADTD